MVWYAAMGLGAFGGFLKSLHREDSLEYPHKLDGAKLDLGFLYDMIMGAGAALVVYLLLDQGVPLALGAEGAALAVALKGAPAYLLAGWAGGSFIDKQVLVREQQKAEQAAALALQYAAPGSRPALEAMLKSKDTREITRLGTQLMKPATAAPTRQDPPKD